MKFGVDKRKVHLSNLILSGQISKEDALKQLGKIPYRSEQELVDDIAYFLKKMRWSKEKLMTYLERPERKHNEFGSEIKLYNSLKKIYLKLAK